MKDVNSEDYWEGHEVLVERSPYGIKQDRWSLEDYQEVLEEVKKLAPARDSLREITETASEQMCDAFAAFMRVDPELAKRKDVEDLFWVDLTVDEQLLALPETSELRRFTRGDLVGAAMATVKMEPTLEVLHDRERHLQEEAKQLQEQRQQLIDAIREQMRRQNDGEGDEPGEEGEGGVQVPGSGPQASDLSDEELEELIDNLRRDVKAREESLKEKLENDEIDIEATLKAMMREVVDEARDEEMSFMAFGIEPGVLTRLPADVRLKYAAKFNQARLRRIAEAFGRMKNVAFAPKYRWVDDVPHEVTGIQQGHDVSRLLPQELARFDDEDLEIGFLADWAEGKLLERKMRGKKKIGRGGIILCEDGSGSMHGDPEIMAKAVMLVLLNICKIEGREFNLVHFGSPGQFKTLNFPDPKSYTLDNVIEAAEISFGGGTDFQTPLDEAMRICREEHARTGAVKSDIIFVTDGQCSVTDAWLEKFRADCERLEIAVWGVSVNGRATDEPLASICAGSVCTVYDLHNPAVEIKNIFAHL